MMSNFSKFIQIGSILLMLFFADLALATSAEKLNQESDKTLEIFRNEITEAQLFLDQAVGPQKSLTPPSGDARREVMNIIGIAAGAVEKSISCYYEEGINAKRPPEMVYRPWVDRMYEQTKDGVEALDNMMKGPWMMGATLTQADVSVVCFWDFIAKNRPESASALDCSNLAGLSERANAMPEFAATIPG